MKKFFVYIGCALSLLSIIFSSACGLFNETAKDQQVGKIGDTLTNPDNIAICLVSCENTKELGSGLLTDTTENNFILLTLKVTNHSNKKQTFYARCVDLYNSKNIKYDEKTSLYIDYILSEDIGAGVTKSFQVVFETPTTTVEEQYSAKIGYSTYTADKDRVVFLLKEKNDSKPNENEHDSDTPDNNNDVTQYWVEDCPITLRANILPTISNLQLVFVNSSDKKIIAYEVVFILYNVYGEALRFAWSDSIYNKLSETPYSFAPQLQDPQYVTITDAVYSAEIYVYYALFEDQTSWGLRQDVAIDDIQKYCKCTKVVKE